MNKINKINVKNSKHMNKHMNKTIKHNMIGGEGSPAGNGGPQIDLQSLTESDIQALVDQGISPKELADIALSQDQPVPPIIAAMLQQEPQVEEAPVIGQQQDMGQLPSGPIQSKTNQFPAMMDVDTYGKYKDVDKAEKKSRIGAHKPNVFGYQFSDLISEEILKDMKRTQGSFLVGLNLSNLFNEFSNMIVSDNQNSKSKDMITPFGKKDSSQIFKRTGEWIDVNYDDILKNKLGNRGSSVPLLPEEKLTDYSTFFEIIDESKKYSTESGFDGKITPYGLLIMARMLFKYRKNNSQWTRVATILELIYKYLGTDQTREYFFKSKDEISIMSLMELEEFYNTDHIFMTDKELTEFKKNLEFYKYNNNLKNIKMQITKLRKQIPPI